MRIHVRGELQLGLRKAEAAAARPDLAARGETGDREFRRILRRFA
jgi:hypothetical protein